MIFESHSAAWQSTHCAGTCVYLEFPLCSHRFHAIHVCLSLLLAGKHITEERRHMFEVGAVRFVAVDEIHPEFLVDQSSHEIVAIPC